MTSTAAKILQAASKLPAKDKLSLVDRLIAELDVPDPAIEKLWGAEAQRRSKAVKNRKMPVKALVDVLAKYPAR